MCGNRIKHALYIVFTFSLCCREGAALCLCDLTGLECDLGCCCDKDCSDSYLSSFPNCQEEFKNLSSCLPSHLLFAQNSLSGSLRTRMNNTCFYSENVTDTQWVESAKVISNYEDALQISEIYRPSIPDVEDNESYRTSYKSFDLINVLYFTNSSGYLSLPLKGTCIGTIYPEYLVNLKRTCYQHSATSSMCSGLPSISQFSPTNFLIMGLPPNAGSYRDYDLHSVPLSAVKCASSIAPTTPISCSSILPNFNAADQTCNSVISKASFRFAHQAGRILDYQIKLWTQDNVTEGFAFNVEIVFFENQIVDLNETAFPPGLQRSGADGYRWGRPLLAGRLSDQNSIEMAPFPLPSEADRQSARGALYAWWVYPSGGDDCIDISDPNRLSFVRFGINSYSACILRYNLSTLSNCTELEDQIKTILTRQWNSTTSTASAAIPTHVACLGASQPEVPSQWTPILFADDAMTERSTTSSGNNECANIIIGQHIRVVYAYQGKVTNPHATVLGAQIEYIRGNIKFLCPAAYCTPRQANRLQATQISTEVSFFDVTQDSTNRDISTVEYHYPSANAWFPFYTYL